MAYCNLDKAIFQGVGKYDIPEIYPEYELDEYKAIIGFNYAKKLSYCNEKVGIHFCLDDYQFETIWNHPTKYIENFRKCGFILSPDFSIYYDTPMVYQIYNHYRKHWLARYYQERGIVVIPTIEWGKEESYEWCFDGEPKNSIVAIETCKILKVKEDFEVFKKGFDEMMKRLTPSKVLCLTHTNNFTQYGLNGNIEYINISTFKNKPQKEI